MKYYIAGPMTNQPYHNVPAFLEAAAVLRSDGLSVIVPCEMDGQEYMDKAMQDPTGKEKFGDTTWGDFLARDTKMIADEADAIVLLPEWHTSQGARLEAFVGMTLNYPIYFYGGDGVLRQCNYDNLLDGIKKELAA